MFNFNSTSDISIIDIDRQIDRQIFRQMLDRKIVRNVYAQLRLDSVAEEPAADVRGLGCFDLGPVTSVIEAQLLTLRPKKIQGAEALILHTCAPLIRQCQHQCWGFPYDQISVACLVVIGLNLVSLIMIGNEISFKEIKILKETKEKRYESPDISFISLFSFCFLFCFLEGNCTTVDT